MTRCIPQGDAGGHLQVLRTGAIVDLQECEGACTSLPARLDPASYADRPTHLQHHWPVRELSGRSTPVNSKGTELQQTLGSTLSMQALACRSLCIALLGCAASNCLTRSMPPPAASTVPTSVRSNDLL